MVWAHFLGGEARGFGSSGRTQKPARHKRGGAILAAAVEALEKRWLLSLSTPFTPAEVRQAYGINNLEFGSTPGDGRGQTIAIIDVQNDPVIGFDLSTFNSMYGLPAMNVSGGPTFTVENEAGVVINPLNDPNAPPNITPSASQSAAAETSLDVEWAHAIAPEANILLIEVNTSTIDDLLSGANIARNTPGVSVVSTSWQGVEFSSETFEDSFLTTPAGHQGVSFFYDTGDSGVDTGYPDYSPNAVEVGGTSLTIKDDGSYGGEVAWSGSQGGVSAYESQPAYQNYAAGAYSITQRTAPDVSWLADPNTGVAMIDSWDAPGVVFTQGGTSLATPMWAALIAIVDQGRVQNGLGTLDGGTQLLPMLYSLPYTDFVDITGGSNKIDSAGPGYDLVTGIGTPVVAPLVRDLSSNLIYVDPDSPGPTHNGSSWFDAYTSLTQALNSVGSSRTTIYVAEGTYTPGGSPTATFQLKDNVTIEGGFAGALDPNGVSNPSRYPTILSGNLGGGVHSYNIVTASGTNSSAVLNGFTITGAAGGSEGGGLYIHGGSPSITDCTFTNDSATQGGGVFDDDNSSPTFADCIFTSNSATYGGALSDVDSSPTLSLCSIDSNSASFGGALYDVGSSTILGTDQFISNTASTSGGAIDDSNSSSSLTNCGFFFNSAINGGGMYNENSSDQITGCTFGNNTATTGGAMFNNEGGNPKIITCTFTSNTAQQFGGGIANENSASALVANSTFTSNTAGSGGGMYNSNATPEIVNVAFINNSAPGGYGGGVYDQSSNANLINCTFTGNLAALGGAISNANSSSSIISSILWNNTAALGSGEFFNDADTPSVTFSDVQDGFNGTGNINANPLFVSPTNPELSFNSPAINAGTNGPIVFAEVATGTTADLADAPRIAGGTVDMGAYESQAIYVDMNVGGGASNGSSWNDAYVNLFTALSAATTLESNASSYGGVSIPIRIYVANGIYAPGGTQAATFQLIDNVTLLGGYAGKSNPNAPRNIGLNRTFLDGDLDGTNSYHVVTSSGTNSTAVLDGFAIVNGAAPNSGGGMFNVNGSPTIANCVFEDDSALNNGGAVYNFEGSPTFTNCVFTHDHVTTSTPSGYNGAGGAVFDDGGSSATFTNCTFTANTAVSAGGAIGVGNGSSATLTNSILWNDSLAGNSAQEIFVDGNNGGTVAIQYSDIQGGYSGIHNINADPLFVNPNPTLGVAQDLQLQPGSPDINTGLNSAISGTSLDGASNPRVAGTVVDMGAYEYQGPFIIYVDQSATHGTNNGTSWANAFTSLQQALSTVATGYTVEVAQGDYSPGNLASNTFQLISSVTIQGGYATGGTSGPNPVLYVTDLDGKGVNTHVVTGSGVNSGAILEGFTIENGHAAGSGDSGNGAGLFNNAGSPIIINCTFSHNSALFGGAIASENNSDPVFVDCIFSNNSAVAGGAAFGETNSAPYFANCVFTANTATNSGGVIYNSSASSTVLNCTFTTNSAPTAGAIYDAYSTLVLTNSILWNDSANTDSEMDNVQTTATITYSDIQGGSLGTGNINVNPLFISSSDLQLQTISPAINAGSNSALSLVFYAGFNTDLAGNPRIGNVIVDMGAYEYQGPTYLVFAQGPTSENVGSTITPAIAVNLEQNAQIARGDNSTVTLSLYGNPTGVVLSGTLSESAVQGVATFLGLSVSKPGTYQIEATDGSDAGVISSFFTITAVSTTPHLVFAVQPSDTVAGQIMTPSVVVDVEQPNGSIISNNQSIITLSIDGGEFLSQALAVNGVATFNNLQFAQTGTYTVVAEDSSDGVTPVPGNSFNVSAATAPILLFFDGVSANIYAGSVITPGLTVREEQNGVTLTSDSSSFVTLSLIQAPSGGTINGTFTAQMIHGVATFNNLTPSAVGVYELGAIDGSESAALLFGVTAPVATQLVFTQQPSASNSFAGQPLPTFQVSVEQNGSVVTSDNSTIEVRLAIPSAGAYGGTVDVQAVNGVATFSNYYIGEAAPTTLKAFDLTNPSDLPGVSNSFIIKPGPTVFFRPSGVGSAGSSTTVVVQSYDDVSDPTPNYNGQVTLTITDSINNIVDTQLANAQNGTATFTNILLDQAGTYYLNAHDASSGADGNGYLYIFGGAATQLVFLQQPSTANAGYPILPAISVLQEDQFGNLASGDPSDVTLSLVGSTGTQLGGVITVSADGEADFDNVSVSQPGTYMLLATDGGLTSAISDSFNIVPPITLYVDQNATGAGTGLDWSDAFTDLQSALAAATAGDNIDVAQGDYSPGPDTTDTYQLNNNVTITGGFATGGIAGPDAALYPTLLDGMNINYHVVTANGTDATAVLQGFTITGGEANGNPYDNTGYGGGLLADGGVPTIKNCIFTLDNAYYGGGEVYIANDPTAAATLLDCTFTSNKTYSTGGAVYIVNSSPVFVNCLFAANSSSGYGGAIYDNHTLSTFTNCTFTTNSAGYYGGAIEEDTQSASIFTNSIFWNDSALYDGDEIHLDGQATPTINNSDIAGGYLGNNNIDADPLFIDAADGNYQLSDTSPAINTGDNNAPALSGILTDLTGQSRIIGGIVDMGTYENHTFISVISSQFEIQPTDSLMIQFSSDVSASLVPGELQLTPTFAGNAASPITVSFDVATDTASFTFSPHVSSGIYTAILSSAGIQDAAGDSMNSDYTFSFLVVNNGDTLTLSNGVQTFIVQQIVIGSAATLDIADDTLIDQYAGNHVAESQVSSWISSGFNNGSWNAPGIISSTAAADSTHATGVGYFDTGSALTIARTWYGDANLDSVINTDDLSLIMLGQAQSGTRWQDGDFIYHQTVNADDWIKLMYAVAVSQGQSVASYFNIGAIIQSSDKPVFANAPSADSAPPPFANSVIDQNTDLLDSPQSLI